MHVSYVIREMRATTARKKLFMIAQTKYFWNQNQFITQTKLAQVFGFSHESIIEGRGEVWGCFGLPDFECARYSSLFHEPPCEPVGTERERQEGAEETHREREGWSLRSVCSLVALTGEGSRESGRVG